MEARRSYQGADYRAAAEIVDGDDPAANRRQGRYISTPSPAYHGTIPATYDAQVGFNIRANRTAQEDVKREADIGHIAGSTGPGSVISSSNRGAVLDAHIAGRFLNGEAGERGQFDSATPLVLRGPGPLPPAALPKKRRLVDPEVDGSAVGEMPAHNDLVRKRYAVVPRTENVDRHPASNGGRFAVDGCVGRGDGGVGSREEVLAPAKLPLPTSAPPLPLSTGRVQGARLMIKGTHPAVPERRIHALASDYGIVGKIEVLEVKHGVTVRQEGIRFWLRFAVVDKLTPASFFLGL